MMRATLFFCILTALSVFKVSGQVKQGDVVNGVPVNFYNAILDGWSACEKVTVAQKEELVDCRRVVLSLEKKAIDQDSAISVLARKQELSVLEIKGLQKTNESLSVEAKKPCPPERKPLLLNPWTYVIFFGGAVVGAYVGSR